RAHQATRQRSPGLFPAPKRPACVPVQPRAPLQAVALRTARVLPDDEPRSPAADTAPRASVRTADARSWALLCTLLQRTAWQDGQPVGRPLSVLPGGHATVRA